MPTIKEEMTAIDRRKFDWYSSLSVDDQKSLSMWMLMRYCSSTNSKVNEINEHYLTMTNELVNVDFNDLRKHPELQFRLMQCVGIGSDQFHSWIKPGKQKKGKSVNNQLIDFYQEIYPHLRTEELTLMLRETGVDDLKLDLIQRGLPDKKIRELTK